MPNDEQIQIAREIELVFEKIHQGENAYFKGEFFKKGFFVRSDLALVVLNENNEIRVSFADQTPPGYAALCSLMLNEIKKATLIICRDYKTDVRGSMLLNEKDFRSTGNIIWDDKERYYSMLKEKVQEVMIRKIKSDENPEG